MLVKATLPLGKAKEQSKKNLQTMMILGHRIFLPLMARQDKDKCQWYNLEQ
jgi:hypothetical protein